MSTLASQFPEDLIFEVLVKLPVKSLQRFKCVCRSWKTLIDSNYFINVHLKSSKEIGADNPKILLLTDSKRRRCSSPPFFHIVDVDSPPGSNQMRSTVLIPPESYFGLRWSRIHGCCNGLVCLNNWSCELVLWNPTIRKYWELPAPNRDERPRSNTKHRVHRVLRMCGFGHDDVEDGYKIVRVVEFHMLINDSFHSSSNHQSVQLYSTRSNSWRPLPRFPYFIGKYNGLSGEAKMVHHSLHWIMEEDDKHFVIVAFHLNAETITLVPQPPSPIDDDDDDDDDYNDFDYLLPFRKDPPNLDFSLMRYLILVSYSGSYNRRTGSQIYFYDDRFIYAYDTNTHSARRSMVRPPYTWMSNLAIRRNAYPLPSRMRISVFGYESLVYKKEHRY
ncbi:OLC1v1006516C1 [Oldenlandia corymbosa var. corymbosa]|uniref:OLC1v1006516C1 n=1 Tax=Oldenlandia corymbosa var. corymbosa TaxID=529605 RepID=A0AAV1DJG0_OLDCO|nr:OLC1v1006516C1 [Oldenlandia corymbosa var. corymbosa]